MESTVSLKIKEKLRLLPRSLRCKGAHFFISHTYHRALEMLRLDQPRCIVFQKEGLGALQRPSHSSSLYELPTGIFPSLYTVPTNTLEQQQGTSAGQRVWMVLLRYLHALVPSMTMYCIWSGILFLRKLANLPHVPSNSLLRQAHCGPNFATALPLDPMDRLPNALRLLSEPCPSS